MTVVNRQIRHRMNREKTLKFKDPLEVVCGVIDVYSASQGISFRDTIDRVTQFKSESDKEEDQDGHKTDA